MQSLKVLLTSIAHKFVVCAWLDAKVQASCNIKNGHVVIYNQTLRDMQIVYRYVRIGSASKSLHGLPHGLAR